MPAGILLVITNQMPNTARELFTLGSIAGHKPQLASGFIVSYIPLAFRVLASPQVVVAEKRLHFPVLKSVWLSIRVPVRVYNCGAYLGGSVEEKRAIKERGAGMGTGTEKLQLK